MRFPAAKSVSVARALVRKSRMEFVSTRIQYREDGIAGHGNETPVDEVGSSNLKQRWPTSDETVISAGSPALEIPEITRLLSWTMSSSLVSLSSGQITVEVIVP